MEGLIDSGAGSTVKGSSFEGTPAEFTKEISAGPLVVKSDAGIVTAICREPNELGVRAVVTPPAVNQTFGQGPSQFDEKPVPFIVTAVWVFSEALVGESDVSMPVVAGGREAYMR